MYELSDYEKRTVNDLLRYAKSKGYSQGFDDAKKRYAEMRGIVHCTRASQEDIEEYGIDLAGWCECGKPINGRWAGMINFCPWCGKIIEWEKK